MSKEATQGTLFDPVRVRTSPQSNEPECASASLATMASGDAGAATDQGSARGALPPDQHSPARLERNPIGYWYALQDHHYFSPPPADVNAPVFYMRLYQASPVRFTEDAPGFASGGRHLFWDVGFGDEFPVLGRDNADRPDLPRFPNTLPAGWAVFVDGDAHMLLDFSAASSAVIDTEFR